jgi:hypothetical protein
MENADLPSEADRLKISDSRKSAGNSESARRVRSISALCASYGRTRLMNVRRTLVADRRHAIRA